MLYRQEEDMLAVLNTQFQYIRKFLSELMLEIHAGLLKEKVQGTDLAEAMEQMQTEQGKDAHVLKQMPVLIELLLSNDEIDLAEVWNTVKNRYQIIILKFRLTKYSLACGANGLFVKNF